ncbi:ComF family protein [bacterium]|nr:ComF family protein [bacterium]
MQWGRLLADCLPSLCQACGERVDRPGDWRRFAALCTGCAEGLRREAGQLTLAPGLPLLWPYAPGVAVLALLKGLKYSGRDGALPLLVDGLAWRLWTAAPPRPWYFLPVPLPLPRRLARGFNQSELLASALRQRLGEGHLLKPLRRRLFAGRQAGRGRAERLRQAGGEYFARGALPELGSLIAIDDLATTGSTLRACQAALGGAASGRLLALTVTRVPPAGVSLDRPKMA